jgi:hypothetical protein
MHKLPRRLRPSALAPRLVRWQVRVAALGMAAVVLGHLSSAHAESPETAPVALKSALAQLDAAANSRNLATVLTFYSPKFTHGDGLNRETLEQSLNLLWKQFPTLSYKTVLKSWQPSGSGLVAETLTTITGTQTLGDREFRLESTLQSKQQFQDQKIVRQDILSERSQLTSGTKPPTLQINLPAQVMVGQDFVLDAIVQEPLGDDLMLGTAIEEPIKPGAYLNPTKINLEALNSGGIFKIGRAPLTPDNRWISAVVVRQDGITMVTQRLRVLPKK